MKVRFRDQVREYVGKLPTREQILRDLGLNPLAVLFIDHATGSLLPPGRALTADMVLEVRTVISGG